MPAAPEPAWRRATLELCVLGALTEGEHYGYALIQRLAAAGVGPVTGGTLYPLLGRLAERGLVTTEWREGDHGPGRKYYALTSAGHDALTDRAAAWRAFTRSVEALTAAPEEGS